MLDDGTRRVRPPRLAALDGLRFVAALAVVLYHFTGIRSTHWGTTDPTPFGPLSAVTRYGFLGVPLFFFISGFVILMTAWGRDVPHFAASRVGRLFPAYWAGVLLTGALLLVTGHELKHIDALSVVANLTMGQQAFGVEHVDGAYWTLWAELRFYLLIGVFLAIGITRGRVLAVAALWPLVAAVAQGTSPFVANLLVADYAPFFAAGMLLYVAHREGWTAGLVLLVGVQVAFAVTKAVDVGPEDAAARNTGSVPSLLVIAAVVLASFAAVALVTGTRLQHLRWGWLTTFGLLTYPLYVLHDYWGLFVISRLHDHLPRVVTALVAVAVALVMAWLVQRFVERPLGPRLRRAVLVTVTGGPRAGRGGVG
ncbi:acyltransferase [Angustibacter aerolatus]